MNIRKETAQDQEKVEVANAAECGAPHTECPNTWKGSCDRAPGHEGSHHCDRCQSVF